MTETTQDTEATENTRRRRAEPETATLVFTNITKGIKGVTTSTGAVVNVDPGRSSPPLKVNRADYERLEPLKWFSVREATEADGKVGFVKTVEDGSPEQDTATLEGNPVKPATAAEQLLASIQASGGMSDDFDTMDDEALREFLKDRDGKTIHPNTSREKLLARARAGGAEDETV